MLKTFYLGFLATFSAVGFAFAQPMMMPEGREAAGQKMVLMGSFAQDMQLDEREKTRLGSGRAMIPLFIDGLSLSASGGSRTIGNRDLILEDGTRVGHELSKVNGAIGFGWKSSSNYKWNARVGAGAASDSLFEQTSDTSFSGMLSVTTPGKKSRWRFGAMLSNNGIATGIPIPIISYIYRPSNTFKINLGLPFLSLRWGSRLGTLLDASVSPMGVRTQFSQSLFGPFAVFAGWQFSIDSYRHINRSDEDIKFFIQDRKASVGLRVPIPPGLMVNLSGGWRYGSKYYQSDSFFGQDAVDFEIEDSSFFEISMMTFF